MGHRSRIREKKPPRPPRGIIHRTKLFGGKMTAQEVHARWGIKMPCHSCGKMPVILIKTLMTHDDFVKSYPIVAAEIARTNAHGPYVPTFPTEYGPMVIVSKVAACKEHQAVAEKVAAKLPSYILVEIDRGPGADNARVAVPTVLDRMQDMVHG